MNLVAHMVGDTKSWQVSKLDTTQTKLAKINVDGSFLLSSNGLLLEVWGKTHAFMTIQDACCDAEEVELLIRLESLRKVRNVIVLPLSPICWHAKLLICKTFVDCVMACFFSTC